MGAPLPVVKAMILPAIVPFNLIKASANTVLTFAVYKAVGRILRADTAKVASETR
jgi:riboflavin transporter FmnP